MGRTNVYDYPAEGYGMEGQRPNLVGWFDYSKAVRWSDADYNGNGSGGTGRGQAILRTSGNKWVLETWTNWQDEENRYEYVSDDFAREWFLRNGEDDAIADHFGDIPEEEDRRPGRPEIGNAVSVRLGDALPMVDAYAQQHSISRAEAVRRLVLDAVTRARVADAAPLSARDNR